MVPSVVVAEAKVRMFLHGPVSLACSIILATVSICYPATAEAGLRNCVLVLDISSSTSALDPDGTRRVDFASFLLTALPEETQLGVVVFGETARCVRPLRTVDPLETKALEEALLSVCDRAHKEEASEIGLGLKEAYTMLRRAEGSSCIILVSDGQIYGRSAVRGADPHRKALRELREVVIPQLRRRGVELHTVYMPYPPDKADLRRGFPKNKPTGEELMRELATALSGLFISITRWEDFFVWFMTEYEEITDEPSVAIEPKGNVLLTGDGTTIMVGEEGVQLVDVLAGTRIEAGWRAEGVTAVPLPRVGKVVFLIRPEAGGRIFRVEDGRIFVVMSVAGEPGTRDVVGGEILDLEKLIPLRHSGVFQGSEVFQYELVRTVTSILGDSGPRRVFAGRPRLVPEGLLVSVRDTLPQVEGRARYVLNLKLVDRTKEKGSGTELIESAGNTVLEANIICRTIPRNGMTVQIPENGNGAILRIRLAECLPDEFNQVLLSLYDANTWKELVGPLRLRRSRTMISRLGRELYGKKVFCKLLVTNMERSRKIFYATPGSLRIPKPPRPWWWWLGLGLVVLGSSVVVGRLVRNEFLINRPLRRNTLKIYLDGDVLVDTEADRRVRTGGLLAGATVWTRSIGGEDGILRIGYDVRRGEVWLEPVGIWDLAVDGEPLRGRRVVAQRARDQEEPVRLSLRTGGWSGELLIQFL
jgi:hypothetical protein